MWKLRSREWLSHPSTVWWSLPSVWGVAFPKRVEVMARALAVEWGVHGVRSSLIAPGYIQTRLIDHLVARGRINLSDLQHRTPLTQHEPRWRSFFLHLLRRTTPIK